jgi:hypothetical protein
MPGIAVLAVFLSTLVVDPAAKSDQKGVVRSARSGYWSDPMTWEDGIAPREEARIQIRAGHLVTYDVVSAWPVRVIHIAGTLTFATDRDTLLSVGLIKIEQGEDRGEDGFDCSAHAGFLDPALPTSALLVGTPERPVGAGWNARIRLVPIAGMDRQTCPAIVCCGGRMDFHGAPMTRTWVKLGRAAKKGDVSISLAESVAGWRVGDHVIITATSTHENGRQRGTLRPVAKGRKAFTEERTITALADRLVVLDRALEHAHEAQEYYRAEVANLSRNVVVESADPASSRGHTMYHRGSSGSISHAEFRHLGKEGVLGKYSLHFHMVGDTMRGSSVIGASIWDSGNRWITIHGTNYLVVRDCVGYGSVGHGFYLEDGSEAYNVLDRNLAVGAFAGEPLPGQFLPFDRNEGAGFWWANSLNSFTRNVAVECDRYGYRYQATPDASGRLVRPVLQPDGQIEPVDIRTLPFVRFEGNEAHAQLGGMNMGEGVAGVGPDERHPFLIRDLRIWESLWSFQPGAPSIVLDGIDIRNSKYGIFTPQFDPRARPYGRMTVRGVNRSGFMTTGPSAMPGENTPLPVGIDDRPPCTIITFLASGPCGRTVVRGATVDNGREARALAANFLEWEVELEAQPAGWGSVTAFGVDAAGNIEPRPHVVNGIP